MSSPINSMNTVMAKNPYSQDTSSMTKSTDSNNSVEDPQVTTGQTGEVQESIAVSQKKQLNAAIIESTLEFSNSLGDQPLSLALKAALQGINEALQVWKMLMSLALILVLKQQQSVLCLLVRNF